MKSENLTSECRYLDEEWHRKYTEALCNDPELQHYLTQLAKLNAYSMPIAIKILMDGSVEYIYSPNFYKIQAQLQAELKRRQQELKSHFHIK